MAKKRILFTWIGNTDVMSIGQKSGVVSKLGPIAAAINTDQYDMVKILVADDHDDPRRRGDGIFLQKEKYASWLEGLYQKNVVIVGTEISDATNMIDIHKCAEKCLEETEKEFPGSEKTFHLSPGTPFMAHVWIVLRPRWNAKLIKSDRLGIVSLAPAPDDIYAMYFDNIESKDWAPSRHGDVIAESESMRKVLNLALRAAPRDTSILLEGETGVGKSWIAKYIHDNSARKSKSWITLNCGAIPPDLLESELFGYVKGAFTGAHANKTGLLEEAVGGTIFLDEIGELSLIHQVKLLDVLQRKKIRRVGDTSEIDVDFRLISATNRQLLRDVNQGKFRKDLYYRIAVLPLTIQPLRTRKEDLEIFIDLILEKLADKGFGNKSLAPEAKQVLLRYEWPGNIRELDNILERVVVCSTSNRIQKQDIVDALLPASEGDEMDILNRPIGNGFKLDDVLLELEKVYLGKAWNATHNQTKATELLGLGSHQTFKNRWNKAFGDLPWPTRKG